MCSAHTHRQLMAAADSLARFAVTAMDVANEPGSGFPCLVEQLAAGCTAVCGCMQLAGSAAHLSVRAAAKLGSAYGLVFRPGRTVLEYRLSHVQPGTAMDVLADVAELCGMQLVAVMGAFTSVLHPSSQPQAAAALAGGAARPTELLPWLAVVTEALVVAAASGKRGECSRCLIANPAAG